VLHIYRHREDIVIAPDRVMTVNAVSACEVRRMPIGQIGTDPSPPAPTCRSLIPCTVANHELNLNELSGLDHSAWIPLFVPGDLSDHGAIRPRIDMFASYLLYRNIVA
jgi:hypothetical protein